MTDKDKLAIVNEVCEIVANNTDLREENSFGDDLAELVMCIAQDKFCELNEDSEIQNDFYYLLEQHFSPDHDVWAFVRFE